MVQECGVGLVELRRDGDALAFRAPGFLRTGPVDEETLGRVIGALGVESGQLVDAWLDRQRSRLARARAGQRRERARRCGPTSATLDVDTGVIGPHSTPTSAPRSAPTYEVRAFCPGLGHQRGPGDRQPQRRLRGVADRRRARCRRRTSRGRAPRWAATDACRSAPTTRDIWVGGASRTVVTRHRGPLNRCCPVVDAMRGCRHAHRRRTCSVGSRW